MQTDQLLDCLDLTISELFSIVPQYLILCNVRVFLSNSVARLRTAGAF